MSKLVKLIYFISLVTVLSNCTSDKRSVYDIELFQDSEVWDLAKAVKKQDIEKIEFFVNHENVPVDFQEPKFGISLLYWSVINKKYYSAEALLKLSADPNLNIFSGGITPFIIAASKNEDKFLELLLEFGGEVNSESKSEYKEVYSTPLISAIIGGLGNVVFLIENGADVDYRTKKGDTALNTAFMRGEINIDIPYYLLITVGADIENATYIFPNGHETKLVDRMRNWTFPLDSEQHSKKMVIANYLKEQGQDYWSTPIPKHLFDVYSVEYLEKY